MNEYEYISSSQPDLEKIWKEASFLIQKTMSSYSYDVWIGTLKIVELNGNTLVFSTPSVSSKNYILKKYKSLIIDSLNKIHSAITSIDLIVPSQEDEEESGTISEQPVQQTLPKKNESTSFNAKFTFDNFIVGPFNQFAAAAAKAVAANPGKSYNPLFIWGGVGLGKTHLLHAIGNYIVEKTPSLKVVYTTTENFTNDLTEAIQNNKRSANREKYRTCDILIIDDIQFIKNRTSTQEEFFNTFNELIMNGKQIVIASDKMPKDINPLEERIRSRLESGLMADVGIPDIETKIAIINKKAQIERYNITRDAVEYIAEMSKTNIREMEGRLSRAVFYSNLIGSQIATLETTKQALKDMITEEDSETDPNKVIDCVCKFYDIKKEDMLGRKRNQEFVIPRQVAMYLINDLLTMPLESIGNIFGKTHATVIHARDKVIEDMEKDKKFAININDIRQMIKGK